MNFKEFVELGKEKAYDIAIDYNYKPVEYRAKYSFEDYLEELQLCPICGEVNERDEMVFHKWDIGQIEELICEGCIAKNTCAVARWPIASWPPASRPNATFWN